MTIQFSPKFFPAARTSVSESGTADLQEGLTDPIP